MKLRFRLSAKKNTAGQQEILLTMQPFVNGKVITMRAKSGVSINEKYFDDKNGIKDLSSRRNIETPEVIQHREQGGKLQSLVSFVQMRIDETDSTEFTCDWLKNVVNEYYHPQAEQTEQENSCKSIYDLAQEYMAKKNLSIDFCKSLQVTMRSVSRYERFVRDTDDERKGFVFDVDAVTKNDMEEFIDYLRKEHQLSKQYPDLYSKLTERYPKGFENGIDYIKERGENSIITEMSKLKAFFSWLNKQGITDNKPFEGVELGTAQYSTPVYITIAERNQIAAATMPSRKLEIQRDAFIFQCLVGCRVSDLMKFTQDNIQDGVLTYTPHKTKENGEQPLQARVPLIEQALQLIEKYNGVDRKGRLFPFASVNKQIYNDAIKAIFAFAGITRKVEVRNSLTGEIEMKPINEVASSHMARRTFIGNIYNNGLPDPNIIGAMSGHVQGSKAFARYRKIEDDTLRSAVQFLK